MTLEALRDAMLTATWQAGAIALLICVISALFGRWIAARWRCALWSVVFIRLVLPALPPGPVSVFRAEPRDRPAAAALLADNQETIRFGVLRRDTVRSAPAPRVIPAAGTAFNWPSVLTVSWLVVATALLVRASVGCALLSIKVRRLLPSTDPRLLALLDGTGIRAFETPLTASPALVGVISPRLLLPPGLIDRITPAELRFIVLHERAHHERRDIAVATAVEIIAALHWFNPLVWLAAARFRAERELACDELVLAATEPAARRDYGRTILRLLELLPRDRAPLIGAVGVLSSGRRTMRRRIARIADESRPPRRGIGPIVVLVVALVTLTGRAQTSRTSAPASTRPAATAPAAAAAAAAADSADPRAIVTQIYDVSDLLIDVPDFGNHVDARGWPVPATNPAPLPSRAGLGEKLVADITRSVDPASWRGNANAGAEISQKDGSLVVTQTRANHEKIQQKLHQLRAPRAVQVTLETLLLTSPAVAQALGQGDAWLDVPGSSGKLFKSFLSDDEVRELRELAQADRHSALVAAPRITLINGQRAFVTVSRETAYVADLAQVGQSFEPVIKILQSGLLLNTRAQVGEDRRQVMLTLNPRQTTLLAMRNARWPKAPAGRNDLVIQVPHTLEATLDATVTVPAGMTAAYRIQPVANQPATRPTSGPAGEPADAPPIPVIMFVRATVSDAAVGPAARPATRPAAAPRSGPPRPLPPLDSKS